MAGTQELDRLLEELRLTSMQMSAGLPPPNPSYSPKPYPSSSTTTYSHSLAHRPHNAYNNTTQTRYQTTRSSSTVGLYGTGGGLPNDRSSRACSTGPTGYNYQRHLSSSSYQTERRLDGLSRPTHYPTYRSNLSPTLPNQRHHTTYTTVLKHRPPAAPKQFSQVHLTIDPDCDVARPTSHGSTSLLTDREAILREQRLESELNSAKREIAQLRRAMSLVEERQRSEFSDEFRSTLTTHSNVAGPRSPSSVQHNIMSTSSGSYQTHQNVPRLGSTFQRTSPRNDGTHTGAFPLNKRTMSHTNVQGPRSWNLRTRQGSESELAYKRITSTSNPSGRSGYSAHRERLKQEREHELLMQKHRQLTASSIGFNDQQYMQQQSRQQQQYRSLSAVNTGGMSDTVEEIETIILQPIGRGVQDIDSRTGSMTTLARPGGGSLMDARSRWISPARMFSAAQQRMDQPQAMMSSVQPVYSLRARSASPMSYPVPVMHQQAPRQPQGLFASEPPRSDFPLQSYKPSREYSMTTTNHAATAAAAATVAGAGTTIAESEAPSLFSRSTNAIIPTGAQLQLQSPKLQRSTNRMGDVEFAIMGSDRRIGGASPSPSKFQTVPEIGRTIIVRNGEEELIDKSIDELQQLQTTMLDPDMGESSLNRMDSQRSGLAGRGYQSTQFLNRTTPTSELIRPIPVHQSQTHIAPSVAVHPLQSSRYGTPTALAQSAQSVQVNGSRSQLSTASSTIVAPSPTQPVTNGWKPEAAKSNYQDTNTDSRNLGIVQDTAPIWYRPNLSREAAIRSLRLQAPGSFLIRDSTTFKGAFGLAVKVATLPPKVTPKSDDLQSELVRHYLIEVVNVPTKGVRLKGFASEPVFPSLAALIHQHTYEPLALPCRLILPPVPTMLPSSGSSALPPLVIGTNSMTTNGPDPQQTGSEGFGVDTVTVTSTGASMLGNAPASSELGSMQNMDGLFKNNRSNDHTMVPMNVRDDNVVASHNVPFVCVLRESPSHQRRTPTEIGIGQGMTFRCLMLGSMDTPQWDNEICFARSVDQLIPLTVLTAAECDNGISRVRYTEVQLHVSAHDGITIIDLQRRLFLRRHLPNHILVYCGLEPRKKEFQHPEHQAQGIIHPQIFGIVVRKGISEFTTYVFSECDPSHTASSIVQHIRSTYPHLAVR